MEEIRERYINPLTDFGFKRLFGSEFNKELLISFLNTLLDGEQAIVDISYLNAEQLGEMPDSRRATFDVYCENDKGEKFIVEMQNVFQKFFKDRSIYYSTFPIREQAKRGEDWDFHLNSVYTVGLLNFTFPEGEDDGASVSCPWHHKVKLVDIDRGTIFYDKLTYVYEEIPKFFKTEAELETMFDKWMFVLRNLSRLMDRPAALQDRIFTHLFEQAEIAKFNKVELAQYEDSVKSFRDIANAIRTAEEVKYSQGKEEGRAEGREEGKAEGRAEGRAEGKAEEKLEIAKAMLAEGLPVDTIAKITGLSPDQINSLK